MRLIKKRRAKAALASMRLAYIPAEDIVCETYTAENVTELERFRASVARLGILVPITVVRRRGHFEVISGARRFAAARACGMERVPCLVIRANDEAISVIRLADNSQRRAPGFSYMAQELRELVYSGGCSVGEAAEFAGLGFDEAADMLHTLRLGDDILTAMGKAGLTQEHALALLRLGDEKLRESALLEMAYRQIPPEAADGYVDALLRHGEKPAPPVGTQIFVMKDVRLFLNSIDRAVDIMRSAGIDAESSTASAEDEIVLTVRIPLADRELNAG